MRRMRHRSAVLSYEALEDRSMLASDPLGVLLIGDSISSGLAPADASRLGVPPRASFRPELWERLESSFEPPLDVEFVGTTAYNPSSLPSEAVRGATARI